MEASAAASPAAATTSRLPRSVPFLIWGVSGMPTVCWAACWDPVGEEVHAFVGHMFQSWRDKKQNKICVTLDSDKRK